MCTVLAKQIKAIQGDLADLNVLEDQISQHVESSEVLDDYEDMKAKNDRQVPSPTPSLSQPVERTQCQAARPTARARKTNCSAPATPPHQPPARGAAGENPRCPSNSPPSLPRAPAGGAQPCLTCPVPVLASPVLLR